MPKEMFSPFLSIIVVTYNAEKTLSATLKSVLTQSFRDWECIVVDGGSSDTTLEIVRDFVELDPRFLSISEKDEGIYDAMNKGWKMAKGVWVNYLGADDTILPDAMIKLLPLVKNADVVYGNTILDFGVYRKIQKSKESFVLSKAMCCCHQSLIMRKEVFEKMDGFNLQYKICSDFDLAQRAFISGFIFAKVDCIVSKFSMKGLSSDNLNTVKEVLRVTKNNHTLTDFHLFFYSNYIVMKFFAVKYYHLLKLFIFSFIHSMGRRKWFNII